ncbi:hypothetical protein SynMINOS11_01114 [Synechococcus sp. Minos11]|nr:hypothetical protein SynMINOS11_01114 [Synechococcus sp. Minos11]
MSGSTSTDSAQDEAVDTVTKLISKPFRMNSLDQIYLMRGFFIPT